MILPPAETRDAPSNGEGELQGEQESDRSRAARFGLQLGQWARE